MSKTLLPGRQAVSARRQLASCNPTFITMDELGSHFRFPFVFGGLVIKARRQSGRIAGVPTGTCFLRIGSGPPVVSLISFPCMPALLSSSEMRTSARQSGISCRKISSWVELATTKF